MNIITSDFKKGFVKLRVDCPEDLWYLSHLIDPGDFVKGKTTRKIKIGEGDNAKTTKKIYTLKIEVETVDFCSTGTALRVNGRIKEGPDDLPLGNYQAIPLEENSEFILEKVQWLKYQKDKLKEAAEKKYHYLICILDREEALLAITKSFGYEILLKMKGDVPKKNKTVEVKKDFQEEIIKALNSYFERYNPESVIIASPVFYREELFKKINFPELKKKIVLATCSEVSENALDEVIKRPELANTLNSSRTRKEIIVVEELLNEISKDNLAVYGAKEVKTAVQAGAVSKLLLTDKFIQKTKISKKYLELDELMKNVENLNGNIFIISSENEGGKKMDGLGGIAALLRYKLKW